MTLNPWRFQFSIARLLVCTTLVAFAAWVGIGSLSITLTTENTGDTNLFPAIACCLLLSAAVGVLIQGREGAKSGSQMGCAFALFAMYFVLPLFLLFRAIAAWITGP